MQLSSGALWRRIAGSATAVVVAAGLTVTVAAPAQAAPVPVTTIVTDPAGNAIDATVDAFLLQPDGVYQQVLSQVAVGGVVSLPVEPGTYKFRFRDQRNRFQTEWYLDKADLASADAVAVTAATPLAPVSLAARPSINGRLVDSYGEPVRSGLVEAYDASGRVGSVNAERDGTFILPLTAGSYKVRFSGNGVASEYWNDKPTRARADAIALDAAPVDLGQVTLSEGSVVTGRVTTPEGAPLERALVELVPAGEGGGAPRDVTDAGGVYRIEDVPPGDYRVAFVDAAGEYVDEFYPDRPIDDYDGAQLVEVGVDATVSLDASLAPKPAIDPATVDLSGVVRDSAGAPVIGATVQAYAVRADGQPRDALSSTQVNRSGAFSFTDLAPGTSASQVKLRVVDSLPREDGQFHRIARWHGGQQRYQSATVVPVPATGVDTTLPLTGGISGTVSSRSGLPVHRVGVELFGTHDALSPRGGSFTVERDGSFVSTSVMPGTYKVAFTDYGVPSLNGRLHGPEWWNRTTFAHAKVVKVVSGKTVGGINAALTEDLRAVRRPEIKGQPYLGKRVRAFPGVWTLETGTSHVYEWLVGDQVVGTGASFKVPSSLKGKRLTLRVTAENGSLGGTALVTSQPLRTKPKVKVKVKGGQATITVKGKKMKPKKIKGNIVVKRIKRTDAYGAPVYKKIGKAKLRKGRAVLRLKGLSRGKHTIVFTIKLKGNKLGDAQVTKKVKVKKAAGKGKRKGKGRR